jgi:serine/threonine protein kinase
MNKNLWTYLVDEKKNAGQGPPLPLLVAINIMLQVAEAMNNLHEMGVIHRDLKANNFLINVLEDQDGCLPSTSVQTKLADFGESKSSCLIPGSPHGRWVQPGGEHRKYLKMRRAERNTQN